jgi:DNA-binding transcriptional MerR regulator
MSTDLHPGQVSRWLDVTTTTLARWASNGRLPCTRTPAGHRRYPAEGVRSLIARTAPGELPDVTLTLSDITALHGAPTATVQGWVARGWLRARRAPNRLPGGHMLLVDVREVQALLHARMFPRGARVRCRASEHEYTVVAHERRPPGPLHLLVQKGRSIERIAAHRVIPAEVALARVG